MKKIRGLVSSDWNECLAPCGPFDVIAYHYPDLTPFLTDTFRAYTGNRISLGTAAARIGEKLPAKISARQMDAYLDEAFQTYPGVPEFIGWCRQNEIAFMINTTGMIGYFQRLLACRRLPPVDILSAHPMVRYPAGPLDPETVFLLNETSDKAVNTAKAAELLDIGAQNIVIIGDSGGDGPHFEWGAGCGALLIGSMTKPSLDDFCRLRGITIEHRLGTAEAAVGAEHLQPADAPMDFMQAVPWIEARLKR